MKFCVYLRLSAVAALLFAAPLMARAGEAVPTENDLFRQWFSAGGLPMDGNGVLATPVNLSMTLAQRSTIVGVQIYQAAYTVSSDFHTNDFVLYRPPFKWTTLLLWLGPALLVAAGCVVLVRQLRARRRREQPALTPEERARVERLLLRGPDARS